MKTYEIGMLVVFVLILLAITVLAVGDYIKERLRRKKHPVWYKYYNRALSNSMAAGRRFREDTKTIDKRKEMVRELFFEGDCSAEVFDEAMNKLNEEYNEAVKRFKLIKEELCIDADLEAADAYAKEHNLKWGILYK